MILESLSSNKSNFIWAVFHCVLGFFCTFTPFALVGWFYLILLFNFNKSIQLLKNNKPYYFFILFSYLISFEVLVRMAKTSPFIPYELGKYLLVLMGLIGLIILGIRSQKGIWMAVLVTPALFYDFSNQRVYFDIINYYLAPLAVGLGLAFSNRLNITLDNLNQILKLIWLGCLSGLVFSFIKTPDLDEIYFGLNANFATTAGHSSNQVSTILGLGMFLSFYSLINKLNYSGRRVYDIIILIVFTFQGLLTFSRGGMMVGALGIMVLVIYTEKSSVKSRVRFSSKTIFFGFISIILLYGVFEIANNITGGNLLLRYQGETEGTLRGSKEVTADHFVTGRIGIFEKDVALWMNNFFTGVGCGSSRYLRDLEKVGVAPHVELSRLLAEHGLLGLFFAVLFFLLPIKSWQDNRFKNGRIILFTLLLIAITTTFHAAMRTFVTPLFIILGSLSIKDEKGKFKIINS